MKFGLAIFATIALAYTPIRGDGRGREARIGSYGRIIVSRDFGPLKSELVRAPSLAILLLLMVTTLGVYKPWGLTRYGQRNARAP